jgi:hypothetical protein
LSGEERAMLLLSPIPAFSGLALALPTIFHIVTIADDTAIIDLVGRSVYILLSGDPLVVSSDVANV